MNDASDILAKIAVCCQSARQALARNDSRDVSGFLRMLIGKTKDLSIAVAPLEASARVQSSSGEDLVQLLTHIEKEGSKATAAGKMGREDIFRHYAAELISLVKRLETDYSDSIEYIH